MSLGDMIADHLQTEDQATVDAFIYLDSCRSVRKELPKLETDPDFFEIPPKNRMTAFSLFKQVYSDVEELV